MKQEIKGSCTIEAAFLMGILLPLFVAIIYMGFFLHDKGFMQGAAFETAACASLHADEKDLDAAGAAQRLVSGRMLGTRGVEVQTDSGDRQIGVSYRGEFSVPGMAKMFFEKNKTEIGAKIVLNQERPSKRIQKIRGVVKVIQTFRRTLE